MLLCLVGPPQAGKDSLAHHLVAHHGFTRVRVGPSSSSPAHPADASSSSTLSFASSSDFLDHVTRTWRTDYVTTDLRSRTKLGEFAKRPFVAIVAIDAPLGVRFRRAVHRADERGETPPSLDQFVEADDLLYHGSLPLLSTLSLLDAPPNVPLTGCSELAPPGIEALPSPVPSPARSPMPTPVPSPELHRSVPSPTGISSSISSTLTAPHLPPDDTLLSSVLPLAALTLPNPHLTLPAFLATFSLPLVTQLLRPSWDTYFMLLASLASLRSNCMKRRVGAVLVRDKRVVSTGYNGTPRGVRNCSEGGCGRCNSHGDGLGGRNSSQVLDPPRSGGTSDQLSRVGEALDECLCLHAEENALLEAGRERVSGGGTEGAVLYCNTCPCLRCTVKIVQCGVKEVIYSLSYSMDAASRRVMEEAGVVLRQMPQPPFPR